MQEAEDPGRRQAKILELIAVAVAAPALQVREALAPLYAPKKGAKTSGEYIVVLDDVDDVSDYLSSLGLDLPQGVTRVFNDAMKGYAGKFDELALGLIRANPKVAYVEEDQIMHTLATESPAPYGLAISSQANRLTTAEQNTYYYANNAGSGVTAYVIDTGINTAHVDFGGRATLAANYINGSPNTDENGHGTHCSGTLGGTTFGIAKSVTLQGIKVLDAFGSGATSGIIAGINFAVSSCPGKCVISMSLGGEYSAALNQAVAGAVGRGVTTVVAAGNEGQDACNTSPASEGSAISVAAIDSSYTRASFSNFGSCTDVFAPGVDVQSDWIGSDTATNIISGTSMATPHIAGLAAYFLGFGAASPADVLSQLQSSGMAGIVADPAGSPNLLGNNGYFG